MKSKILQTMYQSTNHAAKGITPNPIKCKALIKHLSKCLIKINDEKDERESSQRGTFIKDLLSYAIPKHDINGNGNIDIAIKHHDGNVGVIFEYKRPLNKKEMMTPDNLNVKGFQELIQYYLGQITGHHTDGKIVPKNTDRITGIVTNGFQWFIISNKNLYKFFGSRKSLKKQYIQWTKNKKGSNSTKYLRDTFIAPIINKALTHGINIGYFDLSKMSKKDSMVLSPRYQNMFYRFLSPQNLLYEDIFTDSNELNTHFYNELLYLMGLKERKKSKSTVITRNKSQRSTLVNNIIDRLHDKFPNLKSDKLNDIAIQLTVVWMNRFLFLKLLEAQLYSFNNNDDSYKFLTTNNLKNFNDVYDLFFQVLAKRPKDRADDVRNVYSKVPYLNSSLFEPTRLENKYLNINEIGNRPVNIYKHTAIKRYVNEKATKAPILEYILKFLDSYNFSTSSIRKTDKHNDLINASVLGLIFEKINGYKDGAYFTPGWICMLMAHRAVKSAVINKINQALNKHYSSLKSIKFFILNSNDDPMPMIKKINQVINSIHVCDPSVGSGHFLVSVLNELIAIKSYLGVLIDADGSPANFRCRVSNDELITLLMNGQRYYYHRNDKIHTVIQKTLFNEKRYLIENCLFGVDINPNSVEICHLRLWIELLKNAYYYFDEKDNTEHLTTMPNIDINIKTRNSLIHMYPLTSKGGLNKKQFTKYRNLVKEYKNSDHKDVEYNDLHKIHKLRMSFNSLIYTPNRKHFLKIIHKDYKRVNQFGQGRLGETKIQKANRIINWKHATDKYKQDREEFTKDSKVPKFFLDENAMEWRSEFPEVLNKNERFMGFDLIIGNPPYIFARNNSFNSEEKNYYKHHYKLAQYQLNTYHMFIELAYRLLKKNGTFAYIVPDNILTIQSNLALRKFLIHHAHNLILINSKDKLFQGASVDNAIVFFTKAKPTNITLINMKHHDLSKVGTVKSKFFGNTNTEPIFSLLRVKYLKLQNIYNKLSNNIRLYSVANVKAGIEAYEVGKGIGNNTSNNKKGTQSSDDKKNRIYHAPTQLTSSYDKYLSGADVQRYHIAWGNKNPKEKWIKYGDNLAAKRDPQFFKQPRLLVRQIVGKEKHSLFADYINENNVINDRNSMIVMSKQVNLLYLLGIINSSIETFWFAMKYDKFQRKTFPQFKVDELQQFPIPQASHKQVNNLVELVKKIMKATSKKDKPVQTSLDNRIDDYVMNLFGLSNKEKDSVSSFYF